MNRYYVPTLGMLSMLAISNPALAQFDEAVIAQAGTQLILGATAVGGILVAAAGVWVVFKWVKSALKSG